MKKQTAVLLLFGSMLFNVANAQTQKSWTYNFGTTVGNLSPVTPGGIASANDGNSAHIHPVLPAPLDGQIAKVWTGNNNLNGYTIAEAEPAGTGSRLFFNVPPTNSTSKFSILNIDGQSTFCISFKMKFQAGVTGIYRFAVGSDASTLDWSNTTPSAGATQFSNNINFNDASSLPVLLLMHWNLSNSIYKLSVREKRSTTNGALDGFKDLDASVNPNISFVNGGEYDIQIYSNNSSTSSTYSKKNTTTNVTTVYTVAARSNHIWINGVQLFFEANNANFRDAGTSLAANADLNAFVFLGYNNADNVAQVYLDDFKYANYITDLVTLPIELTKFTATPQNGTIRLNWTSASETNNSHFEVLRSKNGSDFLPITKVSGSGTTTVAKQYSATDYNPYPGTNYYQLKQYDLDGKFTSSAVVAAKIMEEKVFKIVPISEKQAIEITGFANENGLANIIITDMAGKKVTDQNIAVSKGYNSLTVPANLQKGVYVLSYKVANVTQTAKFIL